MIRTFTQATRYLESLIPQERARKFPGVVGLKRTKTLLNLLGNPQHRFPTIHVTGTSGKGSTCAMIARILHDAGYRVGLHTSPHLERVTERIQINNAPISDRMFISLVNQTIPVVDEIAKTSLGKPTYFEVLVALSFIAFARARVDIAVIEVGMGGRFDATNVLHPLVAIVTNVGLDHTQILGNTVEKIVRDKMQIIKPGSVAITATTQKHVLDILSRRCRTLDAPLLAVGQDTKIQIRKVSKQGTMCDVVIPNAAFRNLHLSLLGPHQVTNAALAVAASTQLRRHGFAISDRAIRTALAETTVPGRLELVSATPLVILDGAHNPDKIRALVRAIRSLFPSRRFVVVFAAKRDKNVRSMLRTLLPITERFYLTTFFRNTDVGKGLALGTSKLKAILSDELHQSNFVSYPNPHGAIDRALHVARNNKNTGVLVTGSLYLIGEVRSYLLNQFVRAKK